MAFRPAELHVRVGDTVVWTNRDIVPHTATAVSAAWSSPVIPTDSSWRRVVRDTGRVPYFCAPHPQMRGVLVVAPAAVSGAVR